MSERETMCRLPRTGAQPAARRRTRRLALLLLAGMWLLPADRAGAVGATAVDLLIRGGLLVDGRGGEPRRADVAIGDGRILFVGRVAEDQVPAERTIDAAGRIVAPGFIDPHSHGDPLATPEFENFLAMGVTTITLGQDGDSPEVAELGAWLDIVAAHGIGPNVAMFVGHGALRKLAGIGSEPAPDPARLDAMLTLLDDALDDAFGLSTGLEYEPGLHAGAAELDRLAQHVGARGRMIMSHLRSEDDDKLADTLAELLEQGRYARVHVAHLKSVYGKGAGRAHEILALLDAARERGIRVTADLYPYTASYAGIALLFPEWAKTPEAFAVARAERYDELADYLRRRVMRRNGPEATLLGTEPYAGKTLAELAQELGKPFEQVLIDDIGPQGASAAYFVMDDALQSTLLADPHVAVCSDGSPEGFHPRGHGAFARVIEEYVVRRRTLTLGEAVRKMTALPAAILGIEDRGTVEVGKAADLVIFDPDRVHAAASYAAPLQLAEGFDVVIVNGRVARRDGVLDDALHGRVLRP